MLTISWFLFAAILGMTSSFAEEGDFAIEFQLKILAYTDNTEFPDADLVMASPNDDSNAGLPDTSDGSAWIAGGAEIFAPYPGDRANELYRSLQTLKWKRPSPDPYLMLLYDATQFSSVYAQVSRNDTHTAYILSDLLQCNITLNHDPKVPRLDWYVGWGLDFAATMNEFQGKEDFIIECEVASEDQKIGRERDWKEWSAGD
jgi:hypothetical protein